MHFKEKSILLKVGDTYQTELINVAEGDQIKYFISGGEALEVNETGLVTAVAQGTGYVVAVNQKNESDTCLVNVAGIVFDIIEKDITITLGNSLVFTPISKTPGDSQIRVSYDDSILELSSVGATSYKILGKAAGSSELTFDLLQNGEVFATQTYNITVGMANSISFDKEALELQYEENKEVEVGITTDPADQAYRLVSSNPNIVEVVYSNKNQSRLKGLGKCTLTATCFGKVATCKVEVKGIKAIIKGTPSTGHFCSIEVESSTKAVPVFSSATPEICSVDKYGRVTGIKAGEGQVQITVGSDSVVLTFEVVEYFTPKTELTEEDLRSILIVNSFSEVRMKAKGAPVLVSYLLDGLIPLYYIKTNEDPNVFEYQLAILDQELTRYNSLNAHKSPEPEPEPEPETPSAENEYGKIEVELPEEIVANQEVTINSTFSSKQALEKVKFTFKTSGPGNATYRMVDSLGTPFEFVNEGEWGPAEGFDVPEGYVATTPSQVTFDTPGEYESSISLVSVKDSAILLTVSSKLVVK